MASGQEQGAAPDGPGLRPILTRLCLDRPPLLQSGEELRCPGTPILVPGTCEYDTCHGRGHLAGGSKSQPPTWG